MYYYILLKRVFIINTSGKVLSQKRVFRLHFHFMFVPSLTLPLFYHQAGAQSEKPYRTSGANTRESWDRSKLLKAQQSQHRPKTEAACKAVQECSYSGGEHQGHPRQGNPPGIPRLMAAQRLCSPHLLPYASPRLCPAPGCSHGYHTEAFGRSGSQFSFRFQR